VPAGARAKSVHLLTAGTAPRVQEDGGVVTVVVPGVDVHEVVAIDL
jgi:hypothetical protein